MVRKENPDVYATNGPGSGHKVVEFFVHETDPQPVLSFVLGYPGVTVTSNEPGWGSVPVSTPERLKTLRDGLIQVCEHLGIK